MEFQNNILCASHAELTDGIMTHDTLMYYCKKDSSLRVRRACGSVPALYDVNRLPQKYKAELKRRNPDPEAQAGARALIGTIAIDMAAAAYYEKVRIEGARGLTYEKMTLYTNSASILNAIHDMLLAARDEQAKVGRKNRVKLGEWWPKMAEHLPRVADVFPHCLPENPRVLQRKYNEYFRGGGPNYGVLVSGRMGNKNAAKIVTQEQVAWLTVFMQEHTKLDGQEIADYYNVVAAERDWEKVTRYTMLEWLRKLGWAVDAGRLGGKEYLNKYAMQVKRSAPTSPLLYWTLDGWTVELYYKKRTEGKRGGRTEYYSRLTVVVVLDPHNKYPVGYAVGPQECPGLIKAALRNAVNHTAELFGKRYRPSQLQSDNYQIGKMLPVYGALADHVTPAAVGNAKAKVIEPYFKRLNHKYAKKCPGNWSGYGITSRKESQPNREWINAHKGQIPDEAEVRRQIDWIIGSERSLKREEYVARFAKTPADRLLPMTTESYLLNFGEETGHKNALSGSGLNVRLLGERRTYDSFDLDFRKHAHLRWNVRYDPEDLSQVLAVSDEEDIRFLLEEKHVQPMALADRRPGDAEELRRVWDFNDGLKRAVVEHIDEAAEIVRGSLLEHPDTGNPYITGILTDNRGQNKDNKNRYRLGHFDNAEEALHEERTGASGVVSTRDLY